MAKAKTKAKRVVQSKAFGQGALAKRAVRQRVAAARQGALALGATVLGTVSGAAQTAADFARGFWQS